MEVFGPDKVGTKHDPKMEALIDRINYAISCSDNDVVTITLSNSDDNKYSSKLAKIYKKAGWDSIEFDHEVDFDYQTVEMTLRKHNC